MLKILFLPSLTHPFDVYDLKSVQHINTEKHKYGLRRKYTWRAGAEIFLLMGFRVKIL